jgi:hypothetical protein
MNSFLLDDLYPYVYPYDSLTILTIMSDFDELNFAET